VQNVEQLGAGSRAERVQALAESQCEYAAEADAAVLKILLKVKDGLGEDYWWVECGDCGAGWQVPFFAKESVG
jgi:hypothetical protein